MLSFHVGHIWTDYSRTTYMYKPKVAAKFFLSNLSGDPSISLLSSVSDVGLCEDWLSRLCKLLLMSAASVSDSGDSLPAVPV